MLDPDNASIVRTHRSHKYGLSHFKYLNGDRSGVLALAVPSLSLPTKDYGIRVWDLSRNKFCRVFKGHETPIVSLTSHSTRDICLATSADGMSQIWDMREDKPVWTSHTTGKSISTFDTSYNSPLFAISHSQSKSILVHDMRYGDKPVHEFTRLSCGADEMVFSQSTETCDKKLYFASYQMGTITTFDVNKRKEESMIFVSPIRGQYHISLSHCSRYISVSTSSNNVEIWDLNARVKLKSLQGHGGSPMSAFSPIHTMIATASMPLALWVPTVNSLETPKMEDL